MNGLTKEQTHRILEDIQRVSLEIRGLELTKSLLENKYNTIKESFDNLLNDVNGMLAGNNEHRKEKAN